jgi:CTP synthase (UTP-ammonia lyase)
VEHARNVIGIDDANHSEYGSAGTDVINLLSCSLMETTIDVDLVPGSRLAGWYGIDSATEETTCNYGLNVDHQHIASEGGLSVAATDDTGEVRAIERVDHPFFVATLYQPQRISTLERPHPVLVAFVQAVLSG